MHLCAVAWMSVWFGLFGSDKATHHYGLGSPFFQHGYTDCLCNKRLVHADRQIVCFCGFGSTLQPLQQQNQLSRKFIIQRLILRQNQFPLPRNNRLQLV